jgi:hypothetical protein
MGTDKEFCHGDSAIEFPPNPFNPRNPRLKDSSLSDLALHE